jgi:hypothetical protein
MVLENEGQVALAQHTEVAIVGRHFSPLLFSPVERSSRALWQSLIRGHWNRTPTVGGRVPRTAVGGQCNLDFLCSGARSNRRQASRSSEFGRDQPI